MIGRPGGCVGRRIVVGGLRFEKMAWRWFAGEALWLSLWGEHGTGSPVKLGSGGGDTSDG